MKNLPIILGAIAIAAASAGAGIAWQQAHTPMHTATSKASMNMAIKSAAPAGVVQDDSGKPVLYWYDPMVPKQRFDKPGKSPFMDMQLEPKYGAEASAGLDMGAQSSVMIPTQTMQNLGLRLAKVEAHSFADSVTAVGRITADERRFYAIQTRTAGFVEKLLVRAVGEPVARGQKIAEVYAPELLGAQQEYLALMGIKNSTITPDLLQAARNRLKLLGMTEGEISSIANHGKASPRFGIYASAAGVVTELGIREGAQIMPGLSLMQVSDLSQVWLIAEVAERDAGRIKMGSVATISLPNSSNETIKAKVNYLYPSLDLTSRTLSVRVDLPNKGGNLRPGMYANVAFIGEAHTGLAVPTESVITTGTRKVVIVRQGAGFRPVEITSGREQNNQTEVLSGLTENDSVVASGQFLIDSEASLSGVMAKLQVASGSTAKEAMTKESAPVMNMPAMPAMAEKMPHGQGKVTEVDTKSGKVTLAHEPIAELGWPAMTMGFSVTDPKQLTQLKAGDSVEFDLKQDPKTEQYNIEQLSKQMTNKMNSKMEAKP